jgi:hypothetical protein
MGVPGGRDVKNGKENEQAMEAVKRTTITR